MLKHLQWTIIFSWMYIICTIIMCKFHLYVQSLRRTSTVLSFFHVVYMVCMPFNYPWSLHVIVWLFLVPINVTGISGEPTVLEGDNLELTCEALSRLKPNITWTREKPGNQGNTVVVQEGKVLTITNINRIDAGDYTCTAYNGFGKPKNQTVYVNVTCEYTLRKTLANVKIIEMHFPYIFSVL